MPAPRKPRLAILINSLRGGGAERVVSLLLPRLAEEFDVFLVMLSEYQVAYTVRPDQPVHVLGGEQTSDWWNFARLPVLARRYRRYLDENQIDISLSFLNRSNYINCMVKRGGWPGKVVISERAVTSLFYKTGFRKLIGRSLITMLYPAADKIIPISRGVEHDLRTTYRVPGPYQTIYNPINVTELREAFERSTPKDPAQPFTFVCVARFDAQKNQAMLVEAFARLSDVDCRLVLAGVGPDAKAIERQIRDLGLQSRVNMIGFQKEHAQLLRNSDCFVLSSDFEGLGNVILEALTCSLPVISTDCFAGPREILAPGTDFTQQIRDDIEVGAYGVLTPVGNAALMEKAMRLMMADAALRTTLRSRALERAVQFDLDAISADYKRALSETLAG